MTLLRACVIRRRLAVVRWTLVATVCVSLSLYVQVNSDVIASFSTAADEVKARKLIQQQLDCGPMANVMAAMPNISYAAPTAERRKECRAVTLAI